MTESNNGLTLRPSSEPQGEPPSEISNDSCASPTPALKVRPSGQIILDGNPMELDLTGFVPTVQATKE